MAGRSTFKQADVTRALRAAIAAGLKPSGYRITATGEIDVQIGGNDAGPRNSFDAIMGRG